MLTCILFPVMFGAAPADAAGASLQVSAGADTTCAIVKQAAYCWGYNADGQVGNGNLTQALNPTPVTGLASGVTSVSVGLAHVCAVVNGAAYCWGDNSAGQLGDNSVVDKPTPVAVSGLSSGVTAISAGDLHSCAIQNGAIRCWGSNGYGQLGDGNTGDSRVPSPVVGPNGSATAISAGRRHTCAVASGAAYCWGDNNNGSLGNGVSGTISRVPVSVSGLGSGVTRIEAGGSYSCGVASGAQYCWGFNGNGQLGNGGLTPSPLPVPVTGLASGVTAIDAGDSYHACAIVSGAAWCWGYNNAGQLGNPAAGGGSTSPVGVSGLGSGMVGVAAGGLHTCAAGAAGISCWGDNPHGQLGTGNITPSSVPLLVIPEPVVATSLSANPASLAFGGQSVATSSPAQTATITNTGGTTITFTDAAATPGYDGTTDCGTLAPGASCTVTLQFTPSRAGIANGAVEFTTSAGSFTIGTTGVGELSLVTHYYRSILRRAPDAGGKAYWEGEAARMQALGANVNETWYSMSASFYFSPEYLGFNRNNTEFVADLYNTFFNRPADAGGSSFWTGQLAQGMPREVVLVSFLFSTEFTTFTQGIFGNTAVRTEIDTVMDFYRGLLSRLPDGGGFTFWRDQFRVAQCAGAGAVYQKVESISSQFATGAEYAARSRSNSQYVGDLYNSFLRRGGDLAGVQFWIGQLNAGTMTREFVRKQFIASAEFTGRVNAIIAQGCLP